MPQTQVRTKDIATGQEYTVSSGLSGQILQYNPAASLGIGWTNPGAGSTRQPYLFGRNAPVLGGGTIQLENVGTSLVGLLIIRPGTITGASISVSAADASRSYNVEIRQNGSTVATLALASGNTTNYTIALSVSVSAGDLITTFMVRTSGSGTSTFNNMLALVEITI